MRFIRFLVIAFISSPYAIGQNDAGSLLAQGLQQAVTGLAPVPEEDRNELLAATATLLAKHITLRPDGTASSYHTLSARRPVEWRGFVATRIYAQRITEADRLNGITKRYGVVLGSQAHRHWDVKTSTWGEWLPNGTATFPTAVSFEWKNGAWTARECVLLKHFVPGPGLAITQPQRDGKDAGLPPGMTRK